MILYSEKCRLFDCSFPRVLGVFNHVYLVIDLAYTFRNSSFDGFAFFHQSLHCRWPAIFQLILCVPPLRRSLSNRRPTELASSTKRMETTTNGNQMEDTIPTCPLSPLIYSLIPTITIITSWLLCFEYSISVPCTSRELPYSFLRLFDSALKHFSLVFPHDHPYFFEFGEFHWIRS